MARKRAASQWGGPRGDKPEQRGQGRWLVVRYLPVSLFSLRLSYSTSKGGKTLLVPTPYVVKMALLDACFRRYGPKDALGRAREVFDLIKWREVRVRPPNHCVVQNTFMRVLDQSRDQDQGPFRRTIAYREFAFYHGELLVALAASGLTDTEQSLLVELFAHINSLGKRGSFWQYLGTEVREGPLPHGFTAKPGDKTSQQTTSHGTAQMLDDFGEALCSDKDGFDRVSTYGAGTVKIGEHRVLLLTEVPYLRRSASRGFTWYQRVGTKN